MTRLWCAIALLFSFSLIAHADGALPDRRLVVTKDVDFYGSDLQALFDTTLGACQKTCLANQDCAAFTFNTRSNSCFPKSSVSDRQDYEGAVSATVINTSAGAMALGAARATDLFFMSARDLNDAKRQAQGLGLLHQGGKWTVQVLLDAVQDRKDKKNLPAAMHWMGAAVSQSDASDQWLEYARLLMQVPGTKSVSTKTYRARAMQATVNAYLRAGNDAQRVSALDEMSRALEMNGRGRDMIPALRLASDIAPRDDLSVRLEDAIGKYGFRIVEHKVENNSATPRICAEFNEPLVKVGVDYEPFVKLTQPGLAVEASGNQICVSGVTHGSRNRVTFREGLPAATGEKLAKDIELTLYVRDRAPSVRFPGRSYVLPRSVDAGLPVETVNLDKLELTLRRISDRNILRAIQDDYFGRPLSYWQQQNFGSDISEQVWTGTGEVQNTLNKDMTTRLPIGPVVADLDPGIYALSAKVPGADPYDDPGATQWFVLSDLGLTTLKGADGLHVFVRGLSDAAAKAGTEVALVSRANRVLATLATDQQGYVRFDAGLTRGTGGSAPALVTVRDGAARDMAFLSLTDPAFDLSDRGVAGREPAPPIDVFLATDRGAYRAGETIHVTALARDGVAAALPGLPITAILTRPDGVEYSRVLSTTDQAGGHVFSLPLGNTVPRGTWRLDMRADPDAPSLASTSLLVEDFLPERIDFDLTLPDGPISLADTPKLKIEAKYLFGAPGAGLPIEGEVTIRAKPGLEAWPGYRFGRHDERFVRRSTYFVDGAKTGVDGVADVLVDFPDIKSVDRPVQADLVVRVSEGSGRPVERRLSRDLTPDQPLIGIKPMFEDVVAEGTEAAFQLIAVGADLTAQPMEVKWTLNRVRTRYQWYQLYGNWNWESTTSRTRVAGGVATLGAEPLNVSGPVEWGRYELVVERVGGAYTASSTDFYAGWYVPADAASTPDTLELSLDKPEYRSGEQAQLRLVPRYAGTALISVMSNRLIAMKAVQVTEGENLIPLDVTDEWGAGAYVTAQVIRPMDEPAGQNPARALGLSYARIDPGAKQLSVRIDTAAESAPRAPLSARVIVDGVAEGEQAYVTVAATDVGILNLTGFQSPDPSEHYFGQRRLGMEIRDIYGRLINGMDGAMGRVRSGGDAGNQLSSESPPPTQELVAYFSGPVAVGADGAAAVTFDMPEFNGTVRLAAVAWSAGSVGQAEADVLVRDPIVVTASVPRFLAPGDTSRMLLEIVHATGPTGRVGLDVSGMGVSLQTDTIPSGFDLSEGGTQVFSVPVSADAVGDHSLRIALTTPDGKQLVQTLTLPVRANDPEVSTTRRFSLGSDKTFTLDDNVFVGLRAGTGSAMISAGPLAKFDAPGLLSALDRYPYGCTEQVTSRALPLLYFDSVAQAMGLAARPQIEQRVRQSIDRILTRQDSNGAFGLWSAGSGDFWLDAYVSDFLSRAKAQGFEIPATAFRNAMDNLRNRINYAPDFDNGGQDIAYALMVLAREGAAAMGDLRYYADVKADDFATPLALAQLGAALAAYGDQTRADAMFARAAKRISQSRADPNAPVWRVDYGTSLRDSAAVLSLAVEAGSTAVDRAALVSRITAPDRPLSTQEQAWSLLAANAMVADPSMSGMLLNGQAVDGPLVRMVQDDLLDPVAITNTTNADTDVTLTTFGQPTDPVQKTGYGYGLERLYFRMDGTPVSGPLKTGDRLVVVLRVSPSEKGGSRLIINDALPAGLEIDNPNLLRAGQVNALNWLKPASTRHAEFRSDRFLAAVDSRGDKTFDVAYIVRAITPGDYHHPAALVEDMYRPQYRANTASGRLIVTE